MDLLLRLVDKSLIVAEEQGGQARYHMLETIGQFSVNKLLESGEGGSLRMRHLEFFLKFSEQAEAKLHSTEKFIWLHQLGAEYANLHAALEWAREAGSIQPDLRLVSATEQLADVRILLGVGTQAIPLYKEALEWLRSVEGADKMIETGLHRKIIQAVMHLKWRVDSAQFEPLVKIATASIANIEAVIKDAESEPSSLEVVHLLTTLSAHAGYIRIPVDWDLAEKYGRTAVEIAQKLDAPVELSSALASLANVYYWRGLWREFVQVSQQRLVLSRDPRLGDMQERVLALIDVGQALTDVGEYSQAIPNLLEAESLASQMQSVDLEKAALDQRTHSLFRLDRWDEILYLHEKSRDMQQRYPTEQIGVSCYAIAVIASIHALRGEFDVAVTQREEACAIMTAAGGPSEHWGRTQHY